MTDERPAVRCGLLAPVVTLGAIVLATILATPETFTWHARSLSDMGRVGTRTFWLFNGGLIVGGLLGVPFVWGLWSTARNGLERVGTALVGIALAGIVGVGVFFLGHTDYYLETGLHFVAAMTFFGVAPVAQWLYGTGLLLAGDVRLGALSFWLGNVHAAGWFGWLLYRDAVAADPWEWFAVPEFVAAVAFGLWIALVTRSRPDDGAVSDSTGR